METFEFQAEDISLNEVYSDEDLLEEIKGGSPGDQTPEKVKKVYGNFSLPAPPDNRPYVYTSFVFSLDGKIAFPDEPEGPLISKKNFLDSDGADADFWMWNLLKTYSDAAIRGARTLELEDDAGGYIYDADLIEAREETLQKRERYPINLVVSLTGDDIPLGHEIFNKSELTTWIHTSPEGLNYLKKNWRNDFKIVQGTQNEKESKKILKKARANSKNLVISTGEGSETDPERFLKILRDAQIERVLVESPSYTWELLDEGSVDEMFVNYSGVYVGGKYTMGSDSPFTTDTHPHAKLVKVSMHESSFIFTRQKILSGVSEE